MASLTKYHVLLQIPLHSEYKHRLRHLVPLYDDYNQLTKKILPDDVVQFTYDGRGNALTSVNSKSVVAMSYTPAGQLNSIQSYGLGTLSSSPNVTLSFGFDENNNRTRLTDPTGNTTYVYDEADRLTHLTNTKGEVFSFSADAMGRLYGISRPGSSTILSFDDRNFITGIVHSKNGNAIASVSYVLDTIGNKTKKTTEQGNFDYNYDTTNQVTSASNPETNTSLSLETFEYDKNINRTKDQDGNYTYDNKAQRLLEDYRNFYFYDNNGNLTSKQSKNFTGNVTNFIYSSENQLVGIKYFTQAGGNNPVKEVSYAYDALGRRIQKKVVDLTAPGDLTKTFERRYVYDLSEILLEYDGNNQLLAKYTHSNLRTDDVLAVDVTNAGVSAGMAQTTGTYSFLKDGMGTVTDVTDNTGNKIQHYIYSVFGTIIGIQDANAADITNAPKLRSIYSFTGREIDPESGLMFYRARYYSPELGRFMQRDPHPGALADPGTVTNAYAYVSNNPNSFTDPSGKFKGLGALFTSYGRFADKLAGGNDVLAWTVFFPLKMYSIPGDYLQRHEEVDRIATAAAIMTLAAVTGGGTGAGAGALAGGGAYGAIAGFAAGALTGGIVGGLGYQSTGLGSFWKGFLLGAITGGIAGSIAGYTANSAWNFSDASATAKTKFSRCLASVGQSTLMAGAAGYGLYFALIPPPFPNVILGGLLAAVGSYGTVSSGVEIAATCGGGI